MRDFKGALRVPSQQAHSASLPDFKAQLELIRRRNDLPALAAAAVQGGRIVELGATGVKEMGDPTQVTEDDSCWHIGSCTKSMTSTIAAMLIDQGYLDLANNDRRGLP